MDVEFKVDFEIDDEFIDFLIFLLQPTQIIPTSSFSTKSVNMKGALPMGMQELNRKIFDYLEKSSRYNSGTGFDVQSLSLTEKDKEVLKSRITFEKLFH